MKKLRHILCLAALFLLAALPVARAQAPQRISYQAVVRDANDLLVRNADIRVRISIKQTTEDGTTVFSETHDVTTNTNGLFILNIGQGSLVSGSFATIDWGATDYFVISEISLDGGSSYPLTAAQQLLSVPYALYSDRAATATTALNYTETQTLADVVANNPSAGNSQLKNLRNPTDPQDAVTKRYLDSVVAALTVIMTSPHRDTIVAKCGTFTWDRTGQTYTESGIYTYTMANAGCGGTCDSLLNLRLTIATPAAVALNDIVSAGGTSVCTGSEVNLSVEPSSYTGTSITYVWTALSGTDISSSSTNSATIDALAANSEYRVVATATPENTSVCGNANVSKTITITAKTVPTVSDLAIAATNSSIYCEDADSITLTASSTYTDGAAIAYTWSPADGLSATTGASVTASPSSNTTYTVTAVATLDGCASAEQTETQTVTFASKPVIALSGVAADPTTVCAGAEVALSATVSGTPVGTVSYAWSAEGDDAGLAATSTDVNTNTATPTSAGTKTYKVTATATVSGCADAVSAEKSVDVTVNAVPSLTVGNIKANSTASTSIEVTEGDALELTLPDITSDADLTYAWSATAAGATDLGTGTTPSTQPSTPSATTYTYYLRVTAISANGCSRYEDKTIAITVNSACPTLITPTISGDGTICQGSPETLTVSNSGSFPTGTTFSWSNSGSGTSINVSSAGTYTVTANYTEGGCDVHQTSSGKTMTLVSEPTWTLTTNAANENNVSPGSTVRFTAASNTTYTRSYITWEKSAGAPTLSGASYDSYRDATFASAGSYTITAKYAFNNVSGCNFGTKSASKTVTVVAPANCPTSVSGTITETRNGTRNYSLSVSPTYTGTAPDSWQYSWGYGYSSSSCENYTSTTYMSGTTSQNATFNGGSGSFTRYFGVRVTAVKAGCANVTGCIDKTVSIY